MIPHLFVLKFGGTSLSSSEKMKSIAETLRERSQRGEKLVVVVSAMGKSTDELIEQAYQVSSQPPSRELDMLVSVGERISMALLSMALDEVGIQAISLTGSQSGIITSNDHQNAKIVEVKPHRILAALEKNQIVIVAGFQGVSLEKEITTLGRGGSDTTAVALASCLGAQSCEIYTDVTGIYSARPDEVVDAKQLKHLSYRTMMEASASGAGVLHSRSVALAAGQQIPVNVAHAHQREEGTQVSLEKDQASLVVSDSQSFPIRVDLHRSTVSSAVVDFAEHKKLDILQMSFEPTHLWLVIRENDWVHWKKGLEDLVVQEFVRSFKGYPDYRVLSVITSGWNNSAAVLAESLSLFENENISVLHAVVHSTLLRLFVSGKRLTDAQNLLHQKWVESK
ncbi:MAG: aspartate kinase [Bdellovibrionaceae bacterium]|nr:aspartate kinase [Pseudobdellovibrionaceae bacterium]|tara:strand:+ start:6020 stop:7204 length:1185 start_codon:yes stop_codon:yes gene_type:complete